MASKPLNVDGVGRLLYVSPEEMSDHDIRRALVVLACEAEADESAEETAEGIRRFTDATNRLQPPHD